MRFPKKHTDAKGQKESGETFQYSIVEGSVIRQDSFNTIGADYTDIIKTETEFGFTYGENVLCPRINKDYMKVVETKKKPILNKRKGTPRYEWTLWLSS